MRIYNLNLSQYLKQEYLWPDYTTVVAKIIPYFPALLQADYGGDCDCTLTSITAIIYFLLDKKIDVNIIYNVVEQTAKKYFYKEEKGTNPLLIQRIYNLCLAYFGIKYKNNTKYLKGIGYTFKFIKQEIDAGRPIVLSLNSANNKFYQDHSITIVGYRELKYNNKTVRFLDVYDNWYKALSYVDFEDLSLISSINYLI